jgi:hypothetical protein
MSTLGLTCAHAEAAGVAEVAIECGSGKVVDALPEAGPTVVISPSQARPAGQ